MAAAQAGTGGDAYNAEISKSIVGGRGNVNLLFNFAETAQRQNSEALTLLQQKIASGAFHNSDERYDPPKCHPRTRQAVLKKIMEWVQDVQKASKFMWLYGPAGSGKSAIAQTIAEMCYEDGLLAATFFFSRTVAGRNEKTYLITTLVYQMILVIPEIRFPVVQALEHNPLIFSTSLKTQVQALLIQPLNVALQQMDEKDRQTFMSRPHFIIVDGLDECNNEEAQAYILEVLVHAVQKLSIPIFFLIASRPEQQIRDAFNEDEVASLTTTLVLDDTYHPLADIKVLLESKFDDIKRKHPARARFPKPWPSEKDISLLVEKSSGQFIYAATVVKYVESRRHLPPDRLQIVLGLSDPGNDTPFAELDALYNHILSSVFDLDKVIKLFIILLFSDRRIPKRPLAIEQFLFCRPGEIDVVLSDLHSLIVVPPVEDEKADLRISHASLGDFLRDRSRSSKFFIDSGVANAEILRLLFKHLTQDKDNRDAYREWSGHFDEYYGKAAQTPELMEELYNFDLVFFFDFATNYMTPAPEDKRPMMWGNKVPLDSRWPNVAQYFFWLQKLRYPDPSKDFHSIYIHTFSTWLYAQLTKFYPLSPTMRGTRLLLSAICLPNFFSISNSVNYYHVHDVIHAIQPWPDVDTQRWRDPVHIFDTYGNLTGEAAEWYYAAIGKFLADKERAKEYFVDGDLYAELTTVILRFYIEKCAWPHLADIALSLLPPALERSTKTEELSRLLKAHSLRCSDEEDKLYSKKNEVADKIDAFLEI